MILSDRRFTYDEAQQVIESGQGDLSDEITALNALARKLRAARFRNGSISFEREEAKFDLDENGKPLRVYFKEMKEANQLIEEFMLLANDTSKEIAQKAVDIAQGKVDATATEQTEAQDESNKARPFFFYISNSTTKSIFINITSNYFNIFIFIY